MYVLVLTSFISASAAVHSQNPTILDFGTYISKSEFHVGYSRPWFRNSESLLQAHYSYLEILNEGLLQLAKLVTVHSGKYFLAIQSERYLPPTLEKKVSK